MTLRLSRRQLLRRGAAALAALALPLPLAAGRVLDGTVTTAGPGAGAGDPDPEDLRRLHAWIRAARESGGAGSGAAADRPVGATAVRVGERAAGTPYEAFTLEAYIRAGGDPSRTEPLTLSLTRFDCVSLVESCLAIARLAGWARPSEWADFAREMERLRYRGGVREGYVSRLHYFSEWIHDNAARGGMRDLGRELGGERDERPLRFMTEHRDAYPALAHDGVFDGIVAMERRLDAHPRWVVPTARIPAVSDRIESGDVVAFATSIEGLDVTHAAFAYRTGDGVLRVLHAPLSGGVVEITDATLHEYVRAIRRATGILVARPGVG